MISKDELCYAEYSELERIRSLKTGGLTRASIFANVCRLNTLYMISHAGSGHVGSSLSSLDIVSYLYLERGMGAPGGDVYFSSKGHDIPGLYSAFIGLGLLPFDNINKLRRYNGLPGHPDINTPHIVTNTGSLGMGISKARGMALADRLKGEKRHYYVLLGDGELQEGQFWESLQPTVNRGVDCITAIVDHNKLQSDTLVSKVSDLGDLVARVKAHGWAVERCDGHDMTALDSALKKLDAVTGKPKLLIADTVKGKGAGPMESINFTAEDRLYKFHSGAPDVDSYMAGVALLLAEVDTALEKAGAEPLKLATIKRPERPTPQNPQKLVGAYSEAIAAQGGKNENLVVLSADLALDTGLIAFEKSYPDRFIECGIAEQDMVSQAGGMALKGFLPVAHSFACFLSTRPNEQIFNNATELTRVMYVGSLAGAVPGMPGHSHQCIRDIASLSAIPGMELIEPCCEAEVGMAVDYCVNHAKGATYLRLVSIPVEIPFNLPQGYKFERGHGVTLKEGAVAVVIGYGPVMMAEAFKAADMLKADGITIKIVNLPWLNRVDGDWLKETTAGFKVVVTLDNHYMEGGQGRFIQSQLAALGAAEGVKFVTIGVEDGVIPCGQNDEVLKACGLDAASIAERIIKSI
ncbi:MAG: transketolase [Nitrospinae bacterium]|nr:transketolase [Nitrospinota bacterium]